MNGNQRKELEIAVTNGDVDTVRQTLVAGFDLASWNEYGMTLLGVAASAGQRDVVLLLLALGADPEEYDYEGYNALDYALDSRHYEALFCLIESEDKTVRTRRCVAVLHGTAGEGDIYCIERMLANGAPVDAPNNEGMTALFFAAMNGKYEAVQVLLAHGADVTIQCEMQPRIQGLTALCHAALHQHKEIVSLLRKAGAHIDLTEAAMIGDTKTAAALLDQGADPDMRALIGETALFFAAERGYSDTVRLLLKRGADPFLCGELGETAFWEACIGGHSECAALLLEVVAAPNPTPERLKALLIGEKTDINDLAFHGYQSPLMNAVENSNLQLSQLLLQAGADVNLQNSKGSTALMIAAKEGHLEVVRLLLEAGAKVNVKNSLGISILEEAIGGRHTEVEALLRSVGALEGWVRLPETVQVP